MMLCDSKSPFWFRWAPRLLILMMSLTLGLMFALIFLMDDGLDSLESSTLAKSLKESQVLVMVHCVLLGSAIPMLLDALLDFVELQRRKEATDEAFFVQIRTRALLLVSSLGVTIVYGSIRIFGNDDADLRRMPFVYAVSNHIVTLTLLTIIILPVMSLKIIPHTMILAACILQCMAAPLELIHLLSPSHGRLLRIAGMLLLASFFLFMACFAVWGRDVWRRYKESQRKSPFKVETTEFICIFYCSIFAIWSIISWLLNGPVTWRDSDEDNLWPIVVLQTVCLVPVTIIPGRISSSKALSRLQMLSQKQAYVRFVSHEIRSPLSIVSAGLEFFVEHLTDADSTTPQISSTSAPPIGSNTVELMELANDLSEATNTAINIVNDLLQYESMDAGMFKLEAAGLDPADLFKAKALGLIAKRHSLTLEVVPPTLEDGVFVLADVYRIDQVVRNLVTNACKFTPSGGTIVINSEVTFTDSAAAQNEISRRGGYISSNSSRSSGMNSLKHSANQLVALTPLEETVPSFTDMHAIQCGSLRVKVSDTGIGIQDHNKDKLFKQFEQFDKNKLQAGGGSGLGLWISHFIVDCHGGKLQFESLGPGKGSVFFFDLPLYRHQYSITTRPPSMLELPHLSTMKEDAYPRPHTKSILRAQSAPVRLSAPDALMSDEEASVSTSGALDNEKALKQMSYLLVDDSKGNRRILRRMLESNKSILVGSIQEAEDGVDAVALVAEAGSAPDKPLIDCIFMDSVMKQMHGPETVRHLRGKLGFTGKILGLTGNAMADDVKHFQQAGLDLLLIKPLRKSQLVEALSAQGLMPAPPPTPSVAGNVAVTTEDENANVDTTGGEAIKKKKVDKELDAELHSGEPGATQEQERSTTHLGSTQTSLSIEMSSEPWTCPFDN